MNRSRVTQRSELSGSDEWRTPADVFAYAKRWYGPFDLDVAAAAWNAQCRQYFTKADNALVRPWAKRNWDNPPYSDGNKEAFTRWGRLQVLDGPAELVCNLLPHDTGDGYWARHIEAPAGRFVGVSKTWRELGPVVQTRWAELTVEVTAINFRLPFGHESGAQKSNARHASALVVFARPGVLPPLLRTSAFRSLAAPRSTTALRGAQIDLGQIDGESL